MKAGDLTELLETGAMGPDDICPVLYTMSILGQRWKLPILWHLADEGTLRYNELKRGIPLITNIMLTQSLRELESCGLVARRSLDTIPPHVEYSLTERGRTLVPILLDIHAWGRDQMELVVSGALREGGAGADEGALTRSSPPAGAPVTL